MAFRTKKADLANLAREWAQESGLDAQTRIRFRALADEIDRLYATPPTTTEGQGTAEFQPTHRLRERGAEAWIDVRADGTEPQTYYDRDGKTIYAGIWFQHMEVERLGPPTAESEDTNG